MRVNFRYQEWAKSKTDEVIYQRGLRLFLEGAITSFAELELVGWRRYSVFDKQENLVRIPLVHILLAEQSNKIKTQNLDEVVSCDCEFFSQTHQLCRHICAVCASLDKEFKQNKNKVELQKIGSIIDNFFSVEQEKNESKWLGEFETYFDLDEDEQAAFSLRKLESLVVDIFKEPQKHRVFYNRLETLFQEAKESYNREKKLARLILSSRFWLVGQIYWWNIVKPFLLNLHEQNLVYLWSQLWPLSIEYKTIFVEFEADFKKVILNLDKKIVTEILQVMSEENIKFETLVEFALASGNHNFLIKNLENMTPAELVRTFKVEPDEVEKIEHILYEQMMVLSDFLQPTTQSELIANMNMWREEIGESAIYQKAVDYIRDSHPKKKTLIAKI